jgi:hypothetical protein
MTRIYKRIKHQCDRCGRKSMRTGVGPCGCGGWIRQYVSPFAARPPFPCLVREWPAGLFSVVWLAYDMESGDLVPLEQWPIRNVSEAEAREVLEAMK